MSSRSRMWNAAAVGSTTLLLMLMGCASGGSTQASGSLIKSASSTVGALPADEVPSNNNQPLTGKMSEPETSGSELGDGEILGGNPMAQLTALACGDRVDALSGSAGGLVVTAEFPARIERSGGATFVGTVTVTVGDGGRVTGVTTPEADVYLAKSGMVVATPLAKDMIGQAVALGSDDSTTLTAPGTIQPCAANGAELADGRYDVFTVVVITKDDGEMVIATGGPWPIEVS